MELDFDKEIDAILRNARNDEFASAAQNPHLDADEISAFAENALPEKAKKRYVMHLADCDSCRKSLSELILLNAENAPEIVAEKEEITAVAPVEIPWYRKLFAFPNLAYTMGALVLAFAGLTAFIVLQNFNSGNSEVAQSDTSPKEMATQPIKNPAASSNSNMSAATTNSAVSNVSNSNMAANTTVTAPERSPEIYNTNSLPVNPADDGQVLTESQTSDRIRKESDLTLAKSPDKAEKPDAAESSQPLSGVPVQNRPAPSIAEEKAAPKPMATPAQKKAERSDVLTTRGGEEVNDIEAERQDKAKSAGFSARRQISGKTFNRKDGVWYDSAYRNQPTTNIRRSTNDYQKLDSGLRSIGNQLEGVVVVVWKSKAYRIE